MKNNIITTIFCFTQSVLLCAGNNAKETELIQEAGRWVRHERVKFLENKGQMVDMNGQPVPFVLFKAEAPGMDMYITEKGLTYVFLKTREEKVPGEFERVHENKMSEGILDLGGDKVRLEMAWVNVNLKGAEIRRENIIKEQPSTYFKQYYLAHCPDGVVDVSEYDRITIKDVYPKIDWVFYNSSDKGFKYDFVAHPGADPNNIRLIYESESQPAIDRFGNIELETRLGKLTENAPYCYIKETNLEVKSCFTKAALDKNKTQIGFSFESTLRHPDFSEINQSETLIIDPQLVWATFFGGNGLDGPVSIETDVNRNLFVCGYVTSTNFPVCNTCSGYFNLWIGSFSDLFMLKFNNSGVLQWATYYGGTGQEEAVYINLDTAGNAIVTGWTTSTDFALCNVCPGYFQNANAGGKDAFILKFGNTGSRLWATYYGGSGDDNGTSVTIDPLTNDVLVTGYTISTDFPICNACSGYFQSVNAGASDAFILKFNNAGSRLWATYYGGSGNEYGQSVATDALGNLFVIGNTESTDFPVCNTCAGFFQPNNAGVSDIFILKFDNAANRLWATYYGGNNGDGISAFPFASVRQNGGSSATVDLNGNLFVTGHTLSTNLPVLNPGAGAYFQAGKGGFEDMFILKFSNTGTRIWATHYGGMSYDRVQSFDNIDTDGCGNVYVSFETNTSFLGTQTSCDGGYVDNSFNNNSDQYIVKFSNAGVRLWATYFGGSSNELRTPITIDNAGSIFVSGEWSGATNSGSYPLTNPGGSVYFDGSFNATDDGFIAKFIPATYTKSQVNSTSCSPCNGSATINLTCSNPNYNFVWSNGSSTINVISSSNTISGLCPGNYTVTATDNCNQTQIVSFVVSGTVCGGISASVNSASVCTGTTVCPILTATGTGGTAPYTYLWSTGATTASINPCPLNTTNYVVTITDNAGSASTSTSVVTVNPAVSVTATPSGIACNGDAGAVSAIGAGGSSPYSYNWNSGQTSQTISGLSAGNYSVTITDSKGCSSVSTAAIISPAPLAGQFTKGTASCAGCSCKEWLMVNASGGTRPYSYSWPDGYVSRYKNQLCPGTYSVNIKDKNGCSVNINFTVP